MSSKLLFFVLAMILVALVYGFVFANFNLEAGLIFLPISFAVGLIFLALFLIQCLLFNNWLEIVGIIFAETLAMAAPIIFLKSFNYFMGIASVAIFVVLIWAHQTALYKIKNMMKIHLWGLRRAVLSKAIMGITLFSVLSYVSFINLKTFVIPLNLFSYFETPIEIIGRRFVKDFSLKMTADDFLVSLIEQQRPEIIKLTPAQRSFFTQQFVSDASSRIKNITQVAIDTRHSLDEVFYQIANHQLSRLPVAGRTTFLFGVSVILFLFITGFSFLFSWIIILLAWLIYQLLLMTKFIKISYREESVEKIII